MSSKPDTLHCVKRYLASLLISAVTLVSPVALAESADLQELIANPQDYLDQEVEIVGYCTKGGVKGDVVGFGCTTDGVVYITVDNIEPDAAEEKLGAGCDGTGATERSADCRATLRFVPHSYTTSTVIEPGKSVTIFNTKKADVSF